MPEFTAASLKERLESGRRVGPSTDYALSVTGEPYVLIGLQAEGISSERGTVMEGCACESAPDEETAFHLALGCFRAYAEGRSGTLYWRIEPQLEWNGDKTRCRFYMRCLISDKEHI